jgi:hypothetical protein
MRSGPGGMAMHVRRIRVSVTSLPISLLMLAAAAAFAQKPPPDTPERNAYFGETHQHTSLPPE